MFDIGVKVICIDGKFAKEIYQVYDEIPIENSVYTVRDIIPANPWGKNKEETCAVILKEVKNQPCERLKVEYGFLCNRFRELTNIEIELYLKNKKKKGVNK